MKQIDADIKFLRDMATFFERRPSYGEDMTYWANVYNAQNCRRIAVFLEKLDNNR